MSDLLNATAFELAGLIHDRQVSPIEVVAAHIERIEQINGRINAVVAQRFEAALADAHDAEIRVMSTSDASSLPPLLGVPFTVKEFYGVQGLPQSAGIVSRRDCRATEDAEAVRRMRNAGGIVLGVTNVPEGGMWMETYNNIYGRTTNPWDAKRTSGGSSGGEAAIIAAGGSPFGIASDMGGSIRIPAAFCGIVGHKPTGRLVPNTGYFPKLDGEISAFLATGPLARRVSDLMPLLRLMAGPDQSDPVVKRWRLGDPNKVDMRNVVVHPIEANGSLFVWPAVRHAVQAAAKALEARGARVETRSSLRIRKAFTIWSAMMSEAAEVTYGDILRDGRDISLVKELFKLPLLQSNFTAPALIMSVLDSLFAKLFGKYLGGIVAAGKALQAEIESELGPNGVILHPPYTRTAPHHRWPVLTPFDCACTQIFNVMEFPVTAVPVGFDKKGLPLGIQVVGRRGNDHLTIAVAQALEEEFGGWVRADPAPSAPRSGFNKLLRRWAN